MTFKVHKVVSALPGTLQPDAVYAVRVGVGFDLYIADSTGTVAHKVNSGGVTATMPDGATTMSWLNGKLTRVDYPDGSYLLLTWAGSVLASTALHRAGTVRTTTLTWLSGVLQSTTTSTV